MSAYRQIVCRLAVLLLLTAVFAGTGPRAGAQRSDGADEARQIEPSGISGPVERVDELAGTVHPSLVQASPLIHAPQARAAYHVDGNGLTAAVLDTGLRVTHRDFAGRVLTGVNFTRDWGGDPTVALDNHGHGSNVAGIICANGVHTGIAPGADIVPLKVLNGLGKGTWADIAEGLQWVLDHHDEYRVSVVNMSIIGDRNFRSAPPDSTGITEKIRALRAASIAVVAAAGNRYGKFRAEGQTFPAILRETISAGAVYDADIGSDSYEDGAESDSSGPDRITPFSQRLHPAVGGVYRTDLFAPGAAITSAGVFKDTSSSTFQGTSQAAAMVSGVVLLLQELHQAREGTLPSVDDLEKWMRQGAKSIKDGDDEDDNVPHDGRSYRRVDALGAMRAMQREIAGPPSAPAGLRARADSPNSVLLTWKDTSSTETGFIAESRVNDRGPWQSIQPEAPANAQSLRVTGLQPQTHYAFRLRTVNGFGNSRYSNIARTRTSAR